jgi:hypothetical protein
MKLRPTISLDLSFPGAVKLVLALAVGALLVLAPLAARANAAASDFPLTLYLSATTSTTVNTPPTPSYVLTGSGGPGAPAVGSLAAAPCGACGAGVMNGTYSYVFSVVDGGGETAPTDPPVATSPSPVNQSVTVSGLPTSGRVRVYRRKGTSGLFVRIADVTDQSSGSITDNTPDAAAPPTFPAVPQAGNRVSLFATGYAEFQPGVSQTVGTSNPVVGTLAGVAPNNKGWLVDTPGPVKFKAGTWSFTVRYKNGAAQLNGTAHLVVGMWRVKTAGGAITSSTPIIDPSTAAAENGTNLRDPTVPPAIPPVRTVTHDVLNVPLVTLAADEYLYVQFWRRQTGAYTSGTNESRAITLYAYDGVGAIAHPPADDAAPNAFSVTVPTYVKDGEVLSSNPSDPSPGSDVASVAYYYCLPLVDCSVPLNQNLIGSSAFPYSVTWSGQPVDGAYQLFARATDNVSNTTDTAVVPVNVDNTLPDTAFTSTPSDPSNGSPSFSFTSDEPGTFECSLDGAPFSACASPDALSGLATGAHTFQVRAVDRAVNRDASPASFTWTVDATAPTESFSSTPPNPSASSAASFSFTASESATFECRLDGAPYSACTSPRSLSGLADGTHTYEVRATDGVGNTGSTSYSWTIDTITPVVSFSSTPPKLTNSAAATFSFSANEPAILECRLDGAAYSACSSPDSLSAVADGSHTFDVRATDAVGHAGTGSFTWTVDTFPPSTPALETPSAAPTRSLRLTAVYTGPEAGSSGYVEFRVCTDAACANVVASGASEQVVKGATAAWAINVALADGTYFWQARSVDLAGNPSGWSNVWNFTRDTKSPVAPDGFTGVVAADGLTLRWTAPPGDQIANYVVYVNGKQWRVLGEVTYEVKVGPFDAGDTRSFSVSAIDSAGNEGPQTTPLVGVPDLVGLSLAAAKDAVETRGLVLDDLRTVSAEPSAAFVIAQTPPAPSLAPRGSEVAVVLGALPIGGDRPLVEIDSGRVCGVGGFLTLQVRLRERANVNVSVFNARSKRLALRRLGSRPPGLTNHSLHLPKALGRPGRYRVVVTAKASTGSGRDTMSVTVKRPSRRGGARTGC